MMRHKQNQRGFTLIIVIMFMAVLAMVGVGLLNLVQVDNRIVGYSKRSQEAQLAAESLLIEVLGDQPDNYLPALPDNDVLYDPSASSLSVGNRYANTANIYYLRVGHADGFGVNHSRAVFYQVDVDGDASNLAEAEVDADVFKIQVIPQDWHGTLQHGR